jgi:hypothetical protein
LENSLPQQTVQVSTPQDEGLFPAAEPLAGSDLRIIDRFVDQEITNDDPDRNTKILQLLAEATKA